MPGRKRNLSLIQTTDIEQQQRSIKKVNDWNQPRNLFNLPETAENIEPNRLVCRHQDCNESFESKEDRDNHESKRPPYFCRKGCDLSFDQDYYRKDHEDKHSDKRETCDDCGTPVKRARDQKRHKKYYCLYGPRLPLPSKAEKQSTKSEMDIDDDGNDDGDDDGDNDGGDDVEDVGESGGGDILLDLPPARPKLKDYVDGLSNSINQLPPKSGESTWNADNIGVVGEPNSMDGASFRSVPYDRQREQEPSPNWGLFQTVLDSLNVPVQFGDIQNQSELSDWLTVDEDRTQSLRSDLPKEFEIIEVPGSMGTSNCQRADAYAHASASVGETYTNTMDGGTGASVDVPWADEELPEFMNTAEGHLDWMNTDEELPECMNTEEGHLDWMNTDEELPECMSTEEGHLDWMNTKDNASQYGHCDSIFTEDDTISQYLKEPYTPDGYFDHSGHPA